MFNLFFFTWNEDFGNIIFKVAEILNLLSNSPFISAKGWRIKNKSILLNFTVIFKSLMLRCRCDNFVCNFVDCLQICESFVTFLDLVQFGVTVRPAKKFGVGPVEKASMYVRTKKYDRDHS